MISFVVSSYRQDYFNRLCQEINRSVGIEHEIIEIKNRGQYPLSVAYNKGAAEAKHDIICFIHEDVLIVSTDWGKKIIDFFHQTAKAGLVGVAGSEYKSKFSASWGGFSHSQNKINLIQNIGKNNFRHISTFSGTAFEQVRVLDGVLLFVRKSVWEETKFDETIPGYHLYDLDFSLRISQRYDVYVTYEVLITHLSNGNYNDDWLNASLTYHNRSDKEVLFDSDQGVISGVRKISYLFMSRQTLSFKSKIRYVKYLGTDFKSVSYTMLFFSSKLYMNFRKFYSLLRKYSIIKT